MYNITKDLDFKQLWTLFINP